MFVKQIKKILEENNFFCLFIIIQTEKKIFFSIKDILKSSEYDITNKNIIHQTLLKLNKKDIINIFDIKKKYIEDEIKYSEELCDFDFNNLYISDENVFYFLYTLKKGAEFKKCFYNEIFPEIKKFYLN